MKPNDFDFLSTWDACPAAVRLSRTKERQVFKDLGPESLIVIPPYVAHANYFQDGTIMVCGCTTAYDPNDTDSYPYPLLDKLGRRLSASAKTS